MEKAELAIDKLIGYFDSCGYGTAATLYPTGKAWNVRLHKKIAQMGIDFTASIFND